MSAEQMIILLASVQAIILLALGFTELARGWKAILVTVFFVIIISSTAVQLSHFKEKGSKEAAGEATIDQIDTHVRASLSFADYIEAARMNRQAGRTDDAIYDVWCALKKQPNSAAALNLLGVLYFDKDSYDSAIQAFGRIRTMLAESSSIISSGEYLYHRNFGEAYMGKGMWKEAKEELLQCLSLNDSELVSYVELANTLSRLNSWHDLYDVCKRGIAEFPNVATLHNFLGEACIFTARLEEGESALMKAIQADSTFGQPYIFLAIIYNLKKEHDKSEDLVNKALRLEPSLAGDIKILKEKKLLQ